MGWFLTRKKRKTRSKAAPRRNGASPKPWDPHRTLLAIKIIAALTLTGGVVVGWQRAERALTEYITEAKAVSVTPEDVVLADAPGWMSPAVRMRIADVVAAQVGSDPLDGRGLSWAASALGREPWVASVHQVRRTGEGRVEVRADYREPVALVEALDGYHLVDAQGVKLLGPYFHDQLDQLGLPRITGVAQAPPVRGHVWPGDDVQAGLSLLTLLQNEPYFDEIRSFDVSQRDARGRLRLVLQTARGMVRWGLPPGREQAVEPEASVKVARLRWIDQTRGSIDAGGAVVDIYGAEIQAASQPALTGATQAGYSW